MAAGLAGLAAVTAVTAGVAEPFGGFDPVFTPFFPNGTINHGLVWRYADYTTAMGTDTIILGGSTGEWPSLTTKERLDSLVAWRQALDSIPNSRSPRGSKPKIMFHVGDTAVHRALELAQGASDGGADEILIVAPCIMKPGTVEMLLEVLSMISAAAPSLPAWYYHYPSLYNVDFSVTELLELAVSTGSMPALKGVKYIDSNLTDLGNATEVAGGKFSIISTKLLSGMQIGKGTKGAIVYTPSMMLLNQAIAQQKQGNNTGAAASEARLTLMQGLMSKPYGKSGVRAGLKFFAGIDLGPPRLPLEKIAADDETAMVASLKANNFTASPYSLLY